MRETVFQKKCIKWANDNFGDTLLIVNNHGDGYGNKGFPDVTIFGGDSKAIVVELKSDSGYKLQGDQVVWRNRFLRVGTHHYVVKNDIELFKQIVREEFPNETQEELQRP